MPMSFPAVNDTCRLGSTLVYHSALQLPIPRGNQVEIDTSQGRHQNQHVLLYHSWLHSQIY